MFRRYRPRMDLSIRPVTEADVPAVNRLRNHYVRTCTAIYTSEERTDDEALVDFRRRDASRHPLLVATIDDAFAGYGSLSPFDAHLRGYAATVEDSVYVDPTMGGRGVGGSLLNALIEAAEAIGHRNIIARIDSNVPASLALHRKHGFIEAGRLLGVGEKFSRRLDLVLLQRQLGEPAA